jgi:hypothetical protein
MDGNTEIRSSEQAGREMNLNSTKMLSIPELVEHVSLHLDTRALLRAQRVNRCWRNTITGSTKAQKKLFFIPL